MMDPFTSALTAIGNLLQDGFANLDHRAVSEAISAHSEIEHSPVRQRTGAFFRRFVPLRNEMLALLAEIYRRYLRLALPRASQIEADPEEWALSQLDLALSAALEWMREWYILACDGENQSVQSVGSIELIPRQAASLPIPMNLEPMEPEALWRAPAWLFQMSLAYGGIGPLKPQHVPRTDSEERLSSAHTRLLLKGAKRLFLWELTAVIERVRNEEMAAAGAIPAVTVSGDKKGSDKSKVSKTQLRGTEGLGRKTLDCSQYMPNLTDKQQLAFSLKFEYELGLTEIASRMGIDRKTASEHIEAAKRKVDQSRSNEKRKKRRAQTSGEQ
jgi:hypothetical protein